MRGCTSFKACYAKCAAWHSLKAAVYAVPNMHRSCTADALGPIDVIQDAHDTCCNVSVSPYVSHHTMMNSTPRSRHQLGHQYRFLLVIWANS